MLFRSLPYTITATAESNGAISPSGIISVANGGNKTYVLNPRDGNPGYRVDSIFVDGVFAGQAETYSFSNVTSSHTINAKFALNDTTKFRTFKVDVALSAKPNKSKIRSNVSSS